ncbi:MAG TPA: thioredoxin family protein, partial [Planctomycetota bacterium]|nr:thioredoxin family protein [Planctomycetota bacterium]
MLRRLATVALLALPLPAFAEDAPVPAPAPAPEAKPASLPDRITIPLTEVPNEAVPRLGGPPRAGRTGVFVQQASLQVEFEEGAAADGARTWTGTLETGSRKVALRLRGGPQGALILEVDQDGDGKVNAATEALTTQGVAWTQEGRTLGTEWTFAGTRVGGAPVLLVVRERSAGFTGFAVVPARAGGRPETMPLAFSDTVPETVKSAPKLSGKVRYGRGAVAGKAIVVAAARGEGDALTFVWAEAASGDLAGGQTLAMTPTPILRNRTRLGTRWQSAPVAWGEGTVAFQVSESFANVSGMVNATSTRRGTVSVGGTPWIAFLMDGDLDGSFTGASDWWWLGPEQADLRPSPNNMTEGDEPRFVGDDAWRLTGVGKDGAATFTKAADRPSFEDYLRRRTERVNSKRWFPRFESDKKEFAASRGLDLTRPLAATPAPFRFARTLAEAKAMAEKEGKPLLVDFEADGCIWCKRLDYHTYPDAEVVEVLSAFTAVKINNDLDPARSFGAMKSPRGEAWPDIPAIAIFDPDGNPILFRLPGPDGKPGRVVDHIPRWMKPETFVASLHAALEQWKAVKAGAKPLEVEPLAPTPRAADPRMPPAPAPA